LKINSLIKNWGIKVFGLVLLAWILFHTNLNELYASVGQFSIFQIIWLVFISFVIILTKALRFQIILTLYSVSIPFLKSLLIYGAGMFLGTITPGRLGDFSKIFYLKQTSGCDFKKGLFVNVLDRLFDLGLLLIIALGAMYWILNFRGILLYLIFLLIFFFMIILFRKRVGQYISAIFSKLFKVPLTVADIEKIWNLKLLFPFIFTLIPYALIFYQMIFIANCTGFDINPFYLVGTLTLGNLVSLLPISISGLGTREAVFVVALSKIGLTAAQAVSLSLSFFLLNNFSILIISLFLFLILKPDQIREENIL